MSTIGINIYSKQLLSELKKNNKYDPMYNELYSEYSDKYCPELSEVLSSYHIWLNNIFEYMNSQLKNRYFHANNSREAIAVFSEILNIISNIKEIKVCSEYYEKIIEIKEFLKNSGGTNVPEEFQEIKIIKVEKIFYSNLQMVKKDKKLELKIVGEGSYANVYKYYDEDYQKYFCKKILKKNTTQKELERFRREFNTMKSLNSPYIVEVFLYNEEEKSYIMEYLDTTLFDYIYSNNDRLEWKTRFAIINQILKCFSYLESKNILHRDISFKNILIKYYEDTFVIKISDFGLVKLKESTLTDPNSEFKGSLNDPSLLDTGFENYSLIHETYALTRLISFILTGKTNGAKIKNNSIKNFLLTGTSSDKNKRFKNIEELKKAFHELKKNLTD